MNSGVYLAGLVETRVFPASRKRTVRMETAQLVFKSSHGDKVVEMRDGLTLFAGRTIECDIYLPSPAVSRKHAVFLMREGQCGIKDLDSSNGTYLNGERLTKPVRLKEGVVSH